jgi:rhodanese-related sulfurtransferase
LVIYVGLTLLFFVFLIQKYKKMVRPLAESCLPDDLAALLSEGAILWDVRSYREWESRPMPKAEHHAFDQIESCPDVDVVICVCTSGIRARKAAETLKTMGAKRPLWLEGSHLDVEKLLV